MNKGKTVLKGNLDEIKEEYKINKIEIQTKEDISKYIEENGLELISKDNKKHIIKINSEEQAEKMLKNILDDGLKIEKFEMLKPSLHEIFIEKVGE